MKIYNSPKKRIVTLGIETAIKAIEGTDEVMLRHGVWNEYHKLETNRAIACIKASGYGADIFEDESGMLYVSIPNDSDMW